MTTPRELAEKHMQLAADYAAASTAIELVLTRKPAVWQTFRSQLNSDKAADRAYEATQEGVTETALRLKLKSIEKQIGAIKSMLSVMEGENRSQW